MTISLCLIVKDEEAVLARCLASARDLIDEVVVADTGSTDGTVAIAEAMGARVVHVPWTHDFAAARNAAQACCTGDWILVLDADDVLTAGSHAAIRAAVARGDADAFMILNHNAVADDATVDEVMSGARRAHEPVAVARLFRRTDDPVWRGRVHENVGDWLARGGRTMKLIDAHVVHYGYTPTVRAAKRKADRNLALLHLELEERPDAVTTRTYVVQNLVRRGALEEASVEIERAWRDLLDQRASAEAYPPATVFTVQHLAWVRLQLGDVEGALRGIRASRTWGADHPNLDLLEASALERLAGGDPQAVARLEEADALCTRALAAHGQPVTSRIMPGATSWTARSLRAIVRLRLGFADEALDDAAQAAGEAPPEATAPRLTHVEALIATRRADEALVALQPLLDPEVPDGWLLGAWASSRLGWWEDGAQLLAMAESLATRPWIGGHRRERLPRVQAAWRAREITRNRPVQVPDGVSAMELVSVAEQCFSEQDLRGALSRLRAAVALDPTLVTAWLDLAVVLHAGGSNREARRVIDVAVSLAPDASLLRANRAAILLDAGDEAAAAAECRWLAAHQVHDELVHALRGRLGLGSPGIRVAHPHAELAVVVLCGPDASSDAIHRTLDAVVLDRGEVALEVLLVGGRTELGWPVGVRELAATGDDEAGLRAALAATTADDVWVLRAGSVPRTGTLNALMDTDAERAVRCGVTLWTDDDPAAPRPSAWQLAAKRRLAFDREPAGWDGVFAAREQALASWRDRKALPVAESATVAVPAPSVAARTEGLLPPVGERSARQRTVLGRLLALEAVPCPRDPTRAASWIDEADRWLTWMEGAGDGPAPQAAATMRTEGLVG